MHNKNNLNIYEKVLSKTPKEITGERRGYGSS